MTKEKQTKSVNEKPTRKSVTEKAIEAAARKVQRSMDRRDSRYGKAQVAYLAERDAILSIYSQDVQALIMKMANSADDQGEGG